MFSRAQLFLQSCSQPSRLSLASCMVPIPTVSQVPWKCPSTVTEPQLYYTCVLWSLPCCDQLCGASDSQKCLYLQTVTLPFMGGITSLLHNVSVSVAAQERQLEAFLPPLTAQLFKGMYVKQGEAKTS